VNESADRPRRSIDIDIEYLLSHFHPRGNMMRLRPDAARWTGTFTSASTANLRVSDAERNEVADKLSRHFSDGRLDQTEFKERLDAAMSAKTQGDLVGLFDDLPPLASEPPPPPSRRRRLVPFLLMLAFIALVAGSTLSLWHALQIPWLLVALVAFFLWHRARHRRYGRR
jgi:Flp pilus assembly protein TadB